MKTGYTILEALFPKSRSEILRLLFSLPPKKRYVRELVGLSGLNLRTIQDELRRLTAIGLLTNSSDNYHRFYRANGAHPLFSAVTRLVEFSGRHSRTKKSALHPPRAERRRKRKRGKIAPLSANRPPSWGIFSSRPPNSTV